jgi:hypothetical protein
MYLIKDTVSRGAPRRVATHSARPTGPDLNVDVCMRLTRCQSSRDNVAAQNCIYLYCSARCLMSVVCDLLLAEASECPYIVFSDANLSCIAIPSSSSSTKVEALNNLSWTCAAGTHVQPNSR